MNLYLLHFWYLIESYKQRIYAAWRVEEEEKIVYKCDVFFSGDINCSSIVKLDKHRCFQICVHLNKFFKFFLLSINSFTIRRKR